MQFVAITKGNFRQAIELRPKRTQYRFIRKEAVLYSMARAYLSPQELVPFVIEENGRFVGAIRLRNYGRGIGFAAFFIDRKHQGKGIGRKALEHLIEWVRQNHPDAKEIETAVDPENHVACRLYENRGFRYTGVKNDSGTVDMELRLLR